MNYEFFREHFILLIFLPRIDRVLDKIEHIQVVTKRSDIYGGLYIVVKMNNFFQGTYGNFLKNWTSHTILGHQLINLYDTPNFFCLYQHIFFTVS